MDITVTKDINGHETLTGLQSRNGTHFKAMCADKPQGFKDGQMAKRGLFTCFMNCGKVFTCMKDAVHPDCPMRKVLAADVQHLYELHGVDRDEFLKKANMEMKADRKRFEKFLRAVPEVNRDERVREYIQTLPDSED